LLQRAKFTRDPATQEKIDQRRAACVARLKEKYISG
jgi:hypothetical protein